MNRLRNRFTSGVLAWTVVNNPLTRPTGCATRLLLGVNRLLNHCRSPHAKKRWWILLACVSRWDSLRDALSDQDAPRFTCGVADCLSISRYSFDIRTSSHCFLCYVVRKEEKRSKLYG